MDSASVVIKLKYEGVMRRMTVSKDLTYATLENHIRESFALPAATRLTVTYSDKDGDEVTMMGDEDVRDATIHQALNPLRLNIIVRDQKASKGESAKSKEDAALAADMGDLLDEVKEMMKKWPHSEMANSFKDHVKNYEANMHAAAPHLAKFLGGLSGLIPDFEKTVAPSPAPSQTSSAAPCAPRAPGAGSESGKSEENVDQVYHAGVQCDVCGMLPVIGPRFKSLVKDDYDLCNACYIAHGKEGEYNRIERPLYRPRHHPFWGAGPPGFGFRPQGMRCPQFGPHMTMGRPCHPRGPGFMPPNCHSKYDARFVKDVTIFDGTEIPPGTRFTKIWRLRNSASNYWPEATQLVVVGGDKLGLADAVALQQVPKDGLAPGEEIDVSIDMVAPDKPGRYVSHWRLMAPNGMKFGHRMWALIQVVMKDEPSPQVAQSVADAEASSSPKQEKSSTVPNTTDVDGRQPSPKETATETQPEVVEIPVEHNPSAPEEAPAAEATEKEDVQPTPPTDVSPKTEENTSVGGFSLVEMPSSNGSSADSAFLTNSSAAVSDVTDNLTEGDAVPQSDKATAVAAAVTEGSKSMAAIEENAQIKDALQKLNNMGFSNNNLNKELLLTNDLDIGKTVNDLIAAADWDPMLEDLTEMGFYDVDMNRRLMMKNKGSMKRTVKELVDLYKSGGNAKAEQN